MNIAWLKIDGDSVRGIPTPIVDYAYWFESDHWCSQCWKLNYDRTNKMTLSFVADCGGDEIHLCLEHLREALQALEEISNGDRGPVYDTWSELVGEYPP